MVRTRAGGIPRTLAQSAASPPPRRVNLSRIRITGVEPITVLSQAEAELLDRVLEAEPEFDRSELVVYRVRGGGQPDRSLIAPASQALQVGTIVISSGRQLAAQHVSSQSGTLVEIRVAEQLTPFDLDV